MQAIDEPSKVSLDAAETGITYSEGDRYLILSRPSAVSLGSEALGGGSRVSPETRDHIADSLRRIKDDRDSHNSIKAYNSDRKVLERFAQAHAYDDPYNLTEDQIFEVPLWGIYDQGRKINTVTRWMLGIRKNYKLRGLPYPFSYRDEQKFIDALRRQLLNGDEEFRYLLKTYRKRAFDQKLFYAMLGVFDVETIHGARNHALLSNQLAGAFRSAEIVKVLTHHRIADDVGQAIILPVSKTNRKGKEERVMIRRSEMPLHCPVRSIDRYLDLLRLEGPIFRAIDRWGNIADQALRPKAVTQIMKDALRELGLPEAEIYQYASHSSRRTAITWRIHLKHSRSDVMRSARIRRDSTLDVYIADTDPWYDVPTDGVL